MKYSVQVGTSLFEHLVISSTRILKAVINPIFLAQLSFIKHCNKSSVHLFFVEREFCLFVIIVVYPIIHAPLEGKGPMTLRARHSEQVYFNIGHTRMEMTNL